MGRLTRPNLNVDQDTDRFLHAAIGGKEIDWKQSRDSTLNVLINGPTSNGFGKDIFRKMARDLYGRLKAYEDTELEPEEIKDSFTPTTAIIMAGQVLGVHPCRLRELAEADKDGRCVVLPCKVGDTVWITGSVRRSYSEKVRTFFCGNPSYGRGMADNSVQMIRTTGCDIPIHEFGKTVFLTREEAEKALEAMKDE